MSLAASARLGPYEITRVDRIGALKALPKTLLADGQALERFQREARAIAALNHPHICIVHKVGQTADRV